MILPTSLYIHIPWCIQKCPYCDFNSHKSPMILPEEQYVSALIDDFKNDLQNFPVEEIYSIFIGGGTPSLLQAKSYDYLFNEILKLVNFKQNIEITMEANPGTVDSKNFAGYRKTGINRLSLGAQSFKDKHLKRLGRIHDAKQIKRAFKTATNAGFENINIDIMHGLPNQTILEGLEDLQTAIDFAPEHISWYQLTIEQNTVFYKKPPKLPAHDDCFDLEEKGFSLLKNHGYERYEISAFCKDKKYSKHNLNYWQYGDYLGIGAGAHAKLTTDKIFRLQKHRQPSTYLKTQEAITTILDEKDLIFEFMLNTSRLEQPISADLFVKHTGLEFSILDKLLKPAIDKGFIIKNDNSWQITRLGRRFTNELQLLFLPD